jgi:hypothetical protein
MHLLVAGPEIFKSMHRCYYYVCCHTLPYWEWDLYPLCGPIDQHSNLLVFPLPHPSRYQLTPETPQVCVVVAIVANHWATVKCGWYTVASL